jgi:hypothetical protein
VHPLAIPAWFIVPGLYDAGSPRWHSVHGCAVGMWFAGFPVTPALNDTVEA